MRASEWCQERWWRTKRSWIDTQRFQLKIAMGVSSQEYQDLAKKSHMDDLHLEILKLRDRVGAIQRSQDYAKVRLGMAGG